VVSGVPSDLPKAVGGGTLTSAQYEVQVRQQCSNGVWSPWVAAVSNNVCPAPLVFTVNISGSNFVVGATLTSPQTKIEVTMIDPFGGQTINIYDLGGQTGTQNIAIPSGVYGQFTFIGRAVCDATASPIFASAYTPLVGQTIANPQANNFCATPNYGMVFTDISAGTISGLPVSGFASTSISNTKCAYVATLSSGTISVTVSGTPPGGFPIYLRLVKNGTTIIGQVTITAAGTFTLTNTSTINAPDTISIEIDS